MMRTYAYDIPIITTKQAMIPAQWGRIIVDA
jgi:hypothetical protein